MRFTTRAFRKLLSIYVFSYFPFGFEGRIWDLIVSVPDHCLPFYFLLLQNVLSFSSFDRKFAQWNLIYFLIPYKCAIETLQGRASHQTYTKQNYFFIVIKMSSHDAHICLGFMEIYQIVLTWKSGHDFVA